MLLLDILFLWAIRPIVGVIGFYQLYVLFFYISHRFFFIK